MRVGYVRVSTLDQSMDSQRDALEHSGCDKIFQEVASGAKTERPALNAALCIGFSKHILRGVHSSPSPLS
jgi:DNA invertase Pin-like site-specific DNA recombinase